MSEPERILREVVTALGLEWGNYQNYGLLEDSILYQIYDLKATEHEHYEVSS